MLNLSAKDITTEKGFELAEIVVALFSGALFVYFVDENLFFSLDIWKLVLLSMAIILPIFVIAKYFTYDKIKIEAQDQLRIKIRNSIVEKCSKDELCEKVEEKLPNHMHTMSIKLASLIVVFNVIILAFFIYFFWHWNMKKSIMVLYIASIAAVKFVSFSTNNKNAENKDEK